MEELIHDVFAVVGGLLAMVLLYLVLKSTLSSVCKAEGVGLASDYRVYVSAAGQAVNSAQDDVLGSCDYEESCGLATPTPTAEPTP